MFRLSRGKGCYFRTGTVTGGLESEDGLRADTAAPSSSGPRCLESLPIFELRKLRENSLMLR